MLTLRGDSTSTNNWGERKIGEFVCEIYLIIITSSYFDLRSRPTVYDIQKVTVVYFRANELVAYQPQVDRGR